MPGRILRLKDLITYTGLSRSAIYDRMDDKSPRYAADFPKSFSLDGGAVGWFQDEIDAWLEKCAAQAKDGRPPKKSNVIAKANVGNTAKEALPRPRTPPKQSGVPGSRSLGETLVKGEKINTRIQGYLQMATWTPTMGALLISGIAPPADCNEIPKSGVGLDDKPLHASNARFREARRILEEWHYWEEDHEAQVPSIEPHQFLIWCIDEEINAEWLSLILELKGCTDEKTADLTAARFAILTGK